MDTDYTSKRSKRPLIIIGGAVVALIIVAIAVASALSGPARNQQTATTVKNEDGTTVATKEQVQKNLDDLDSSVKQAQQDQQAAKTSLTNNDKQIKVNE